MPPTSTRPPGARLPLGSLDGPSRTIRVEPVETPVTAPPPRVAPEPDHQPAPAPSEPRPAEPTRSS